MEGDYQGEEQYIGDNSQEQMEQEQYNGDEGQQMEGEAHNGDNGAEGGETGYCEVCEETYTGSKEDHEKLRLHFSRDRYKKRIEIREKLNETFDKQGLFALIGVNTKEVKGKHLEIGDWMKIIRQPLVGMSYIYEILPHDSNDPRFYACRLCGIAGIQVVEHMISITHRIAYMVQYQDEVLPIIEEKTRRTAEIQLIKDFIEHKGFPLDRADFPGQTVSRILTDYCGLITAKMPKSHIVIHKACGPSEKKIARQTCVKHQLRTVDDAWPLSRYPVHLIKKLFHHGANFALYKKAPQNPSPGDIELMMYAGISPDQDMMPQYDDYGPPPDMAPPLMREPFMGRPPRGMAGPMPPAGGPPKKVSLLAWMHKTAQKVDMEGLGMQERDLCLRIIELLNCGIELYRTNPTSKDICYHPNANMNPDAMHLRQWLEVTIDYFESAWLCSDHEVNMANVLINQIQQAVQRFAQNNVPVTMGMASAAKRHQDPYEAIGGAMGGNFGGDYGGYSGGYNQQRFNPKQGNGRKRNDQGKPYQKGQRGGKGGRY